MKLVQSIYVCKEADPENLIIGEINIDCINFEDIKKIIKPRKRDPELLENYPLTKSQLNKINNLLDDKIVIDLESYFYLLAREGDYSK